MLGLKKVYDLMIRLKDAAVMARNAWRGTVTTGGVQQARTGMQAIPTTGGVAQSVGTMHVNTGVVNVYGKAVNSVAGQSVVNRVALLRQVLLPSIEM